MCETFGDFSMMKQMAVINVARIVLYADKGFLTQNVSIMRVLVFSLAFLSSQ